MSLDIRVFSFDGGEVDLLFVVLDISLPAIHAHHVLSFASFQHDMSPGARLGTSLHPKHLHLLLCLCSDIESIELKVAAQFRRGGSGESGILHSLFQLLILHRDINITRHIFYLPKIKADIFLLMPGLPQHQK